MQGQSTPRRMAKKKCHPMAAFFSGKRLSLEQVYDLLVEDFENDGKADIEPTTTFYDPPPTGMGYSNALVMQNFLNNYVNSAKGKTRYNLGATTVIWEPRVQPEKKVGYLAGYIRVQQQT
jgi:hypothetical protein